MSWVPMSGQERRLFTLLMRQRSLPHKTLARGKGTQRTKDGIEQTHEMETELLPHLPFVVLIAKKYRGYAEQAQLDFLDLIHEGFFGLVKAHRKFDRHTGSSFITYARYWIEQSLARAIDQSFSRYGARVPTSKAVQLRNLDRTARAITSVLNRPPEREELIAEWMRVEGADREETLRLIDYGSRRTVSLSGGRDSETETNDEDHGVMVASLEPNPEDVMIDATRDAKLLTALEKLDVRQKQVLYMRFGLSGHTPQAVRVIADSLRLSRQRVRELETEALNKLREEFRFKLDSQ